MQLALVKVICGKFTPGFYREPHKKLAQAQPCSGMLLETVVSPYFEKWGEGNAVHLIVVVSQISPAYARESVSRKQFFPKTKHLPTSPCQRRSSTGSPPAHSLTREGWGGLGELEGV